MYLLAVRSFALSLHGKGRGNTILVEKVRTSTSTDKDDPFLLELCWQLQETLNGYPPGAVLFKVVVELHLFQCVIFGYDNAFA